MFFILAAIVVLVLLLAHWGAGRNTSEARDTGAGAGRADHLKVGPPESLALDHPAVEDMIGEPYYRLISKSGRRVLPGRRGRRSGNVRFRNAVRVQPIRALGRQRPVRENRWATNRGSRRSATA